MFTNQTFQQSKQHLIFSRLHSIDGVNNLFGEQMHFRPRLDTKFKYRYLSLSQILLITNIPVAGDKKIKLLFGHKQEFAIAKRVPSHPCCRRDAMTFQKKTELRGCAVIQQYSHAAATSSSRKFCDEWLAAKRKTSWHCSMLSGSYQLTKSSSDAPSARLLNRYDIGRRVWLKHHCPPMRSGSRQTAGHSLQSNSLASML